MEPFRPAHGAYGFALTARGERNALCLRERLAGIPFARVYRSPLRRASRTCELAGFGAVSEAEPLLVEWNYGDYEGLRTAEIHARRPDWQIFRDGCPGGESPVQVAGRADLVVERVRAIAGNVLLFSSGHFLRMLAMRWLEFEPMIGGQFLLDPASVSILGCDENQGRPELRLWNETRHLTQISQAPEQRKFTEQNIDTRPGETTAAL